MSISRPLGEAGIAGIDMWKKKANFLIGSITVSQTFRNQKTRNDRKMMEVRPIVIPVRLYFINKQTNKQTKKACRHM
jgi:hypothetical protein